MANRIGKIGKQTLGDSFMMNETSCLFPQNRYPKEFLGIMMILQLGIRMDEENHQASWVDTSISTVKFMVIHGNLDQFSVIYGTLW